MMFSLSALVVLAPFVVVSVVAQKVPWTSLSAKFSFDGVAAYNAGEAFFPLPTTTASAQQQGWVEARQEEYTSLWCLFNDPRVCLIYDQQGCIAGMQIFFPVDDMNTPYDWTLHSLFQEDTIFGQKVAGGRVFFVSQNVLQSGGRACCNEIGTGLWLQDGDNFTYVPQNSDLLEALGWTVESCFPGMGRHYYYNISSTMSCNDFEPFFLLADNEKNWVHGFGFQTFGNKSKENREWEEDIDGSGLRTGIPNAPECLITWANEYGVKSLHVYFIEQPYNIEC